VQYLSLAQKESQFSHEVFGRGMKDEEYNFEVPYNNLSQLPTSLVRFLTKLHSVENLWHIYNNAGSRFSYWLSRLPIRSKLVAHERGFCWTLDRKQRCRYQAVAMKADLVLANSQATAAMLNLRLKIPAEKIQVLYNGIVPPRLKLRKEASNDRFKIGFLGRLEWFKGIHIFLQSAALLKDERQLEFFVAGDGNAETYLRETYTKYPNIHFLSRIQDSHAFLSSIDILVVPSLREALGNVCLEAGMAGAAVIAANVDGIPEIVENDHSGILLSPDSPVSTPKPTLNVNLPQYVIDPETMKLRVPTQIDARELADKIHQLSREPAWVRKLATNLKEKVHSQFCLKHYFKNLESIYATLYSK
jgi:glycosyltransferase involved in cell wall biosynthesis